MATGVAARAAAPAVERALGRQVSRTRSLLAAAVVGTAAGVATYRLLRSGSAPADET